VTKPNTENCKNCSSKYAYDCIQLQYTIQHIIAQRSRLNSTDSPALYCTDITTSTATANSR